MKILLEKLAFQAQQLLSEKLEQAGLLIQLGYLPL